MESKWEGSEKEGRGLASLPVILALWPRWDWISKPGRMRSSGPARSPDDGAPRCSVLSHLTASSARLIRSGGTECMTHPETCGSRGPVDIKCQSHRANPRSNGTGSPGSATPPTS